MEGFHILLFRKIRKVFAYLYRVESYTVIRRKKGGFCMKIYELKMPANYVKLKEDEMMYVDGGYAYTAWQYTNVAVSVGTLAFLIDAGAGLVGGVVAKSLGITLNAATSLLGEYASNKAGVGNQVAKFLDKNGNGWVGLYTRDVYTGISSGKLIGFIGSEYKTE
jgi:hypothetical protein